MTREEWLEKNGFNAEGKTYIYFPADSYSVKEQLKSAGFRFSQYLMWHAEVLPECYADACVEVSIDDVAEMTTWGEGLWRPDVKKIVNNILTAKRPHVESKSQWLGQEKDKLYDLPCRIAKKRTMESRFGLVTLIEFVDENENVLNWWTSTNVDAEIGDSVLLTGTIKKLDEYKGVHQTVMTRCKLASVSAQ